MQFDELRQEFIQHWGAFASSWGINRTMAQIHAILMISPDPMTAEQIVEELKVSRGNVSMNVRNLIEWGIVHKVLQPGDRKEYFTSEKDVWKMATQIAHERRRRELEPVVKMLHRMREIETKDARDAAQTEFETMITRLSEFADAVNAAIKTFEKKGQKGFFQRIVKFIT